MGGYHVHRGRRGRITTGAKDYILAGDIRLEVPTYYEVDLYYSNTNKQIEQSTSVPPEYIRVLSEKELATETILNKMNDDENQKVFSEIIKEELARRKELEDATAAIPKMRPLTEQQDAQHKEYREVLAQNDAAIVKKLNENEAAGEFNKIIKDEVARRKKDEENDAAIALALQNEYNIEHGLLDKTEQGKSMIANANPIYEHMVRDVENNENIHGIYAREILYKSDEVPYYRKQFEANHVGNNMSDKEQDLLKQRAIETINKLDPNSVWALSDAEKETRQQQMNRSEKDNVEGQLPRDGKWEREFPKDQKTLSSDELSELRAAQFQLDEILALEKEKRKAEEEAATQAFKDRENIAHRRRMMRLKQGENPKKKAQSAFP